MDGLDAVSSVVVGAVGDAVRKALGSVGSGVRFGFPIAKVDEESRMVEGVATTEDCDSNGEILEYLGSVEAFRSWRGNLREQHDPMKAVGRSIAVDFLDRDRAVVVRAYISKGAADTWTKVKEGVLTGFSVGGSRLKSRVREDGVRVTSQWRMDELSLVDVPANPATKVSIVKVLRRDGEVDRERLASALDALARQLSVGCRPLPHEVTRVLALAGSTAQCDSVAARDWKQHGPPLAQTLGVLCRGLRSAEASDADIEKITRAVPFALSGLMSMGRAAGAEGARLEKSVAGVSVPTAEELREEIAKALRQLDSSGIPKDGVDYRDIRKALECDLLKLRGPGAPAGGAMQKRTLSLAELAEMEERLASALHKWHSQNLPQNVPEYRELSEAYWKVAQRRKAADRRAMARR